MAGQELRRLRVGRGWSQEQVAEQMKAYGYDWHQTLIGRIESAQRPLRLNEAVDLAMLFGVSIETLLRRAQRDLGAEKLSEQITQMDARLKSLEAELGEAERELIAAEQNRRVAEMVTERMHGYMANLRVQRDALAHALNEALDSEPERPS